MEARQKVEAEQEEDERGRGLKRPLLGPGQGIHNDRLPLERGLLRYFRM
jgi:hypothetical protein